MFKRLKRKFTLLATVSVFLLMCVLVGAMNLINYSTVVSDAQSVLHMLSNGAPFGEVPPHPGKPEPMLPPGMSPEVPYESRYFTVTVSPEGDILQTDTSRIVSVDSTAAADYAQKAMQKHSKNGFLDRFRYHKEPLAGNTRIVFLDCGRKLDAFYRFLYISFAMALLGCLIVFLVFLFAADHILRPIAESYEKQKRFVTDAGHEIKTPLTVIRANVDLLEADCGENESLSEIRRQTEKLTALTENLVRLSKIDEAENALPKIDFPFSDLALEAADNFSFLALTLQKQLRVCVQPNLSMYGAPDAIRQLLSVILENAVKYSPQGETITLDCTDTGKALHITVRNKSLYPVEPEKLPHVFDRFYRMDASRNSETGGQGIGLSVAQAITEAHGGKITVSTTDGTDFRIDITLPK